MTAAGLEAPAQGLSDGVVRLRPFTDPIGRLAEQLVDACQDPTTQRFIPIPSPYGPQDAEDYLARTRREWADGTKAAFAIVDDGEPDRLLGAINVAIVGASGNSGYWVAPGVRQRGVATRALTLLTDWAFDSVGLGVIVLEIRPENEASRRVAAKVGYHLAGRLEVPPDESAPEGAVALIFSRLASDPA